MKFLFLSPNQQCLKNLIPIAKKIQKKDHSVTFLNLDSVYKQNTSQRITNFDEIGLDIRSNQAFYFLDKIGKLKLLFKIYIESKKIPEFTHVIIGSMGTPEYLIAKRLKKKNEAKIYLIQDSILFNAEKKGRLSYVRNLISGGQHRKEICEKIFTSGEATKEVLMQDGVSSDKIIVSGIPRFKYIFDKISKQKNDSAEKKDVLFLTSAFKWHDSKKGDNREKKQLKIIDRLEKVCKSNGLHLTVRLHPRLYLKPECCYAHIEHQDVPLEESIDDHKYIVSAHAVSTVLLESLWFKKKVIFIAKDNKKGWDIGYLGESLIWTDLQGLSKALNQDNDYSNNDYYISKNTKHSVKLILDEIFED